MNAHELLDMFPYGDARHYAIGVLAEPLARDGKITVETWQAAMREGVEMSGVE